MADETVRTLAAGGESADTMLQTMGELGAARMRDLAGAVPAALQYLSQRGAAERSVLDETTKRVEAGRAAFDYLAYDGNREATNRQLWEEPTNVVTKQEGPERSAEFSYTTGDDAKAVIAWYERTLKEKRFTIVGSTVFDASTAKLTAQDPTGRSILNIRMEPAGARKVVAVEAREGGQ